MYSLEHIKWIDSGFSLSTHVWQDKDDLINLLDGQDRTVDTVGYNVLENEDWIVLVQSVNCPTTEENENLFRGGYLIFKKTIIEREALCKI